MQRSWQHNGSKSTIHDSSGCQVPTGSYPTIAVVFLYVLLLLVVVGAVKGAQSDGCALVLSNTTSQTVVLDLNLHSDVVFSNDCVLRDTVVHFQPPEPPRTAVITMDGVTVQGGAVLLDAMPDRNLTGITILVRNASVNKASGFFTQTQPSHTVSHIHMHIANSTINVPSDKGAFSIEAHTVHNISITAVDGTNIDSEGMVCSCVATDAATNIQLHAVGDVAVHTTGPAAFSIIRHPSLHGMMAIEGSDTLLTVTSSNISVSISKSTVEVTNNNRTANQCAAVASICSTEPKTSELRVEDVTLRAEVNGPSSTILATTSGYAHSAAVVAGVSVVCSSGSVNCSIETRGSFSAAANIINQASVVASHGDSGSGRQYMSSALASLTVAGKVSNGLGIVVKCPVIMNVAVAMQGKVSVLVAGGGGLMHSASIAGVMTMSSSNAFLRFLDGSSTTLGVSSTDHSHVMLGEALVLNSHAAYSLAGLVAHASGSAAKVDVHPTATLALDAVALNHARIDLATSVVHGSLAIAGLSARDSAQDDELDVGIDAAVAFRVEVKEGATLHVKGLKDDGDHDTISVSVASIVVRSKSTIVTINGSQPIGLSTLVSSQGAVHVDFYGSAVAVAVSSICLFGDTHKASQLVIDAWSHHHNKNIAVSSSSRIALSTVVEHGSQLSTGKSSKIPEQRIALAFSSLLVHSGDYGASTLEVVSSTFLISITLVHRVVNDSSFSSLAPVAETVAVGCASLVAFCGKKHGSANITIEEGASIHQSFEVKRNSAGDLNVAGGQSMLSMASISAWGGTAKRSLLLLDASVIHASTVLNTASTLKVTAAVANNHVAVSAVSSWRHTSGNATVLVSRPTLLNMSILDEASLSIACADCHSSLFALSGMGTWVANSGSSSALAIRGSQIAMSLLVSASSSLSVSTGGLMGSDVTVLAGFAARGIYPTSISIANGTTISMDVTVNASSISVTGTGNNGRYVHCIGCIVVWSDENGQSHARLHGHATISSTLHISKGSTITMSPTRQFNVIALQSIVCWSFKSGIAAVELLGEITGTTLGGGTTTLTTQMEDAHTALRLNAGETSNVIAISSIVSHSADTHSRANTTAIAHATTLRTSVSLSATVFIRAFNSLNTISISGVTTQAMVGSRSFLRLHASNTSLWVVFTGGATLDVLLSDAVSNSLNVGGLVAYCSEGASTRSSVVNLEVSDELARQTHFPQQAPQFATVASSGSLRLMVLVSNGSSLLGKITSTSTNAHGHNVLAVASAVAYMKTNGVATLAIHSGVVAIAQCLVDEQSTVSLTVERTYGRHLLAVAAVMSRASYSGGSSTTVSSTITLELFVHHNSLVVMQSSISGHHNYIVAASMIARGFDHSDDNLLSLAQGNPRLRCSVDGNSSVRFVCPDSLDGYSILSLTSLVAWSMTPHDATVLLNTPITVHTAVSEGSTVFMDSNKSPADNLGISALGAVAVLTKKPTVNSIIDIRPSASVEDGKTMWTSLSKVVDNSHVNVTSSLRAVFNGMAGGDIRGVPRKVIAVSEGVVLNNSRVLVGGVSRECTIGGLTARTGKADTELPFNTSWCRDWPLQTPTDMCNEHTSPKNVFTSAPREYARFHTNITVVEDPPSPVERCPSLFDDVNISKAIQEFLFWSTFDNLGASTTKPPAPKPFSPTAVLTPTTSLPIAATHHPTPSFSVTDELTISPQRPSQESSITKTRRFASPTGSMPATSLSISRSVSTTPFNDLTHPVSRPPSSAPATTPAPPQEEAVDEAVQSQKVVTTVATSTVVVASVASGGGGSVQDMQTMIVLGSMACADQTMKDVASGGERSVVPFQMFDGPAGAVASNLLLSLVAAAVQLAAAALLSRAKGRRFRDACATLRFPSLSFTLFVLLYQGTALSAFDAVASSSTPSSGSDMALGGAGLVACAALPLVGPVALIRRKWRVRYIRYRHLFASTPSVLRAVVLPTGFYDGSKGSDPTRLVPRFNTLFSSLRKGVHPCLLLVPFVKALIVAGIAVLKPETVSCPVQYGIIGAVHLAVAALAMWKRPSRMAISNVLSCLMNLVTAGICFGSAKPDSAAAARMGSLVALSAMLGLVATLFGIVFKALEYFRWKRRERRLRESQVSVETESESGSSDEGDSVSDASSNSGEEVVDVDHGYRDDDKDGAECGQLMVPLNPLHEDDTSESDVAEN